MGHQFATNMENPGRWRRWVLREISSMVDNGYFLEPHKGDLISLNSFVRSAVQFCQLLSGILF